MEQGGCLDEAPIDRRPALVDPGRQPAGDLGDRPGVAERPGRWLELEQEGGGRPPVGDRTSSR